MYIGDKRYVITPEYVRKGKVERCKPGSLFENNKPAAGRNAVTGIILTVSSGAHGTFG